MKLSGVYSVKSIATGKEIYVSGASDIRQDWFNQLMLLNKGKHPDLTLQDHINKYGKKDLVMSAVQRFEIVSKVELAVKIKKYKDNLKPKESVKESVNPVKEPVEKVEEVVEKAINSLPAKVVKKRVPCKKKTKW